jgi:hypothetical protein
MENVQGGRKRFLPAACILTVMPILSPATHKRWQRSWRSRAAASGVAVAALGAGIPYVAQQTASSTTASNTTKQTTAATVPSAATVATSARSGASSSASTSSSAGSASATPVTASAGS